MSIDEVKNRGFMVYVKHRRRYLTAKVVGSEVKVTENFARVEEVPKGHSIVRGGYTIVELVKGEQKYMGTAHCSVNDNFNKKIGLSIALGRALKEANEYEQATQVLAETR